MQIDDVMALVDEYVSASIEDHGYRSGAASAEYLEDTKRKLLAAIESLISAPAAPQQAEPAIAIEVTQDADGTWSLTVPTYFPCMPVGKHDLYLHPPAAEVQRLRDALEDLLHHAETHRAEQVWVLRASEVADIARRALEGK
jgi:hypothetical protein